MCGEDAVAGESAGQAGWKLAGLAPGAVVAGYRIESWIGAGGMAVVFRARDEALGRMVALKVLAPALADDAEFRERFIRESRAAAAVDHPHIIPVYAAGEAGGVLYIAMRFVAGGDLRALLQREGPLPADRAVSLLSALASALDAGHAAGLVHRDVKPANILIDTSPGRSDHPYLSDFGLAKGAMTSAALTGTGRFLGTLEYSAPEQISGSRARPQTDQYALACVGYIMLTGTVPFPRDEPTAVLWAHMADPPPPVTALRPDLPPAADQVFARGMAKAAEDRYHTCGQFVGALRAAVGGGDYPAPGHAFPPADSSPDLSPPRHSLPGPAFFTPTLSVPSAPVPPSQLSFPPSPSASFPPSPSDPVDDRTADWAASLASAPEADGQATTTSGVPGVAGGPRQAAPPRRHRRRRGALAIAGTAIVVLAGGAGGVLALHPWTHPPVLRPAGLAVDSSTANSLTIGWYGPATGPVPDKYKILRDGGLVATIPGYDTNYKDSGLTPGTAYWYQVIAIRGGKQSPRSATLNAMTVTPPLAAAVLDWSGSVQYTMTSLQPPASSWDEQPGDSWLDTWSFTPTCASGPCDVTLDGAYDGADFSVKLTRLGATYSGTASVGNAFYCEDQSDTITAMLSMRITVAAAQGSGTAWTVTSFSGTATLNVPAMYSCSGETAQLKLAIGPGT